MRFLGDKPQGRVKGHPPLAGMRQNGFDWVSYLWVSGPEWFSSWGWMTYIETWGSPAATFRLSRYRLGGPLSPESAGDFNQKDNKDKNMNKMCPKPCVHKKKKMKKIFFKWKPLLIGVGFFRTGDHPPKWTFAYVTCDKRVVSHMAPIITTCHIWHMGSRTTATHQIISDCAWGGSKGSLSPLSTCSAE